MQHEDLTRLEREYLACVWQRASYLDDAKARLDESDLWGETHRRWYAALLRIYQDGNLDWMRLSEEIGSDDAAKVTALEITTPTLIYDRARRIRAIAQRRKVEAVAKRIVLACDNDADISTIAELVNTMRECVDESDATDIIPHREALLRTVNHLDEISKVEHAGITSPVCGAGLLKPYRAGQLVVVAGRPGMGKSAFAWQECATMAEDGHAGLVVSLEMRPEEMVKRDLARRSGITTDRMQSGQMSTYEHQQINDAIKASKDLAIHWTTQVANVSVASVAGWVRRLKRQGHDLRWVAIDYLQLMRAPSTQRREEAIAQVSRGLKLAALELDVTVILLAQLNRKCEDRDDKRPHISDLRESGAIEQDADTVLLMWRPGAYPELADKHDAADHRIIIAKQRGGGLGDVHVRWHGSTTSFHPAEDSAWP